MHETKLIILGGFAGAGKTTIAKKLSRDFNLPLFIPDEFIEVLSKELQKSFHEASPIAYDVIWHIIRKHLKNGVSVIFDANMCHDRSWQTIDQIKKEFPHVHVLPFLLKCSLEEHKRRIEHRGKTESDHLNLGGDDLEKVLFKYEYINGLKREDVIEIDANPSVEEVYTEVLKHAAIKTS